MTSGYTERAAAEIAEPQVVSGAGPECLLSLNQERVLLSQEVARRKGVQVPGDAIHVPLTISGPLDLPALEKTLHDVIRRHNALRNYTVRNATLAQTEWESSFAAFARTGIVPRGLYLQKVVPSAELKFHRHDFRRLKPKPQAEAIRLICQKEAATPLENSTPLGLRVNLVRLDEEKHLLIAAMDHRNSDGWSAKLLRREIEQLYRHYAYGEEVPATPRMSYLEFTAWQNGALASSSFDQDLAYWEEHWREFGSARVGVADLPFARSVRSGAGDPFQTERLALNRDETASLRDAARRSRATLHMLFLATFITILRHYTGKTKVAVWSHCLNRTAPETTDVIGFFINTHLMGFDLSEDLVYRDLLKSVAARQLETLKHQQMPLPHLWRTLRCIPRFADSGIMLDYLIEDPQVLNSPGASGSVTFTKTTFEGQTPARMASIGVYVTDRGDELSIRSDYVASLYPSEAVKDMLGDVKDVALAFSANPDVRISDFAAIAGRYADRPRMPRTEMSEFIVLGSDRIPTRTS